MANKQHYDDRAKARQAGHTTAPLHIYRHLLPTIDYIERFEVLQEQRKRIAERHEQALRFEAEREYLSRLSVSDWNAALPDEPFTCQGEAYRSNGLGAVIDWGRPAQKVAVAPVPVSIVARAGADAVALLPAKVA